MAGIHAAQIHGIFAQQWIIFYVTSAIEASLQRLEAFESKVMQCLPFPSLLSDMTSGIT